MQGVSIFSDRWKLPSDCGQILTDRWTFFSIVKKANDLFRKLKDNHRKMKFAWIKYRKLLRKVQTILVPFSPAGSQDGNAKIAQHSAVWSRCHFSGRWQGHHCLNNPQSTIAGRGPSFKFVFPSSSRYSSTSRFGLSPAPVTRKRFLWAAPLPSFATKKHNGSKEKGPEQPRLENDLPYSTWSCRVFPCKGK